MSISFLEATVENKEIMYISDKENVVYILRVNLTNIFKLIHKMIPKTVIIQQKNQFAI